MGAAIVQLPDQRVARRFRRGGSSGRVEHIGQGAQIADVEGQAAILRAHQHRGLRPQRVAHAQFVIDIGIENGEVGDRVIAEREPFEHRLVDHAGVQFLIGAHHFEADGADRRIYDLLVDHIEIDLAPRHVRFAAEGHDNEADGAVGHEGASRFMRCATNSRRSGCARASFCDFLATGRQRARFVAK